MRINTAGTGSANHSGLGFNTTKSRQLEETLFFPLLYVGSHVNLKHIKQYICSGFGFRQLDQKPRIYCLFLCFSKNLLPLFPAY